MIIFCLYIIKFTGGGGVVGDIECVLFLVLCSIYGVSMLYFVFFSFYRKNTVYFACIKSNTTPPKGSYKNTNSPQERSLTPTSF